MYRLSVFLLFVLSVSLVEPRHNHDRSHCHRRHEYEHHLRHQMRAFDSLAGRVISADKKAKEYCEENSNSRTSELYSTDKYTLLIPLDGYKDDNVSVKIKYRVIYISVDKSNDTGYFELRILPEIVDVSKATWDFIDSKLEIVIPYNNKMQSVATESCGGVINESILSVPRYTANLDLRQQPDSLLASEKNKENNKENEINQKAL